MVKSRNPRCCPVESTEDDDTASIYNTLSSPVLSAMLSTLTIFLFIIMGLLSLPWSLIVKLYISPALASASVFIDSMDAVTIGLIGFTVVAGLFAFVYKMYASSDEDTFAKAMAEKQLHLLHEGPNKDKKTKPKKKNDDKKKVEKKKEQDKPAVETSTPEPAPVVPAKEAKKEKQVEKKEEEKKQPESPAKKEEVAPVKSTVPEQKKTVSPPAAAPAKKKEPKKVEEPIENLDEFVEAKPKKAKKQEKKEAAASAPVEHHQQQQKTRPYSLKDLDTEKVVSRLALIDEIEVEYIEYLNNFFRDASANSERVLAETTRAQRAIDDSARNVAALKAEKSKVEKELEGNRRAMAELASKAAQSSSSEMTMRTQLTNLGAELERVRREAEQYKKAAAEKPAPAPVQIIDHKEEVEKLKAEAKAQSARVADLEEQLRNVQATYAKEKKQLEQTVLLNKSKEDAVVGQEVLLAESRQNVKAISQRLTEIEHAKIAAEARVEESEKIIEGLRSEADKREATHAKDTQTLKKMIDELNNEVQMFEAAKKEQKEILDKLSAKEKELAEKSRLLEAAEKEKNEIKKGLESAAETKIAALEKRIAELEAEKAAAAEIVIPANNVVEEVVELKRSNFLDAAPPAASDASNEKIAALEEELARVQEKNTELRTRNFAMLDQVTELEKRLMANGPTANGTPAAAKKEPAAPTAAKTDEKEVAKKVLEEQKKAVQRERKLVHAYVGALVAGQPKVDENTDVETYEAWLKSVGDALREAQNKAKQQAKKAAPKPSAAEDEIEKLRVENECYKEALEQLEGELQNIDQLQHEREASFNRRIAELEHKYGAAKSQIAEVRSRMDEVSKPRTVTTSTVPTVTAAPADGPDSPSDYSQSECSYDGSWEVVA